MSEEKNNAKPETQAEKNRKRTQPVVIYLSVLVIVVAILLIMSYFMQRRNSEELESLNQSVTSIQSTYDAMNTINTLQSDLTEKGAEIDKLEGQISDYEEQVADLQEQLDTKKATEKEQSAELETEQSEIAALKALIQLQEAYNAEDYDRCKELLSEENTFSALTDEETALYQSIKTAVEKQNETNQ